MEGRHAVAELLAAGRRRAGDVWVVADAKPSPVLDRIVELTVRRRVPLRRVSRERLAGEARTSAPQGVLAHAEPLAPVQLEELLALDTEARQSELSTGRQGSLASEPVFLLALDGVTDPQNVGSLLRSGAAAGVGGVLLPRHRSAHITPAVTKAAAGAIEHVPLAVVPGLPAGLVQAKAAGCWVVGLSGDGRESLFDLSLAQEPLVLVLGAEGEGLGPLTRKRCDSVVRIPIRETVSSLNVGVAGALAMFEVRRARQIAH